MASALTASPLSDGFQATTDYSYDYDYNDNGSLVILGEDEPQQFGGTFSGVLYTLIFILSLVGNSFLLWALLVREDLRKTTTLFLLQLAVSDLLLTLTLPFWAVYHLHHWVFGMPGCHLLVFLFFLGFYGYMAFLAAVTVDRYLAVVHAVRMLRLPSRLCVALSSASLWLVCVIASIPEAVHSETVETGRDAVPGGASAAAPGAAGIRRAGQPVLPPPLRPHPLLLRAHLGHRVQVQVGQAGAGRAADLLHGAGVLRLLGALQRGADPGRPAAPGLPRADGARGQREAGVCVLRVPHPGLLPLLPQPRPPRLRQWKVPQLPLRP
ncbi:hypothetical protein ANANG_G00168790, partial [Anguilla anguilla]